MGDFFYFIFFRFELKIEKIVPDGVIVGVSKVVKVVQ